MCTTAMVPRHVQGRNSGPSSPSLSVPQHIRQHGRSGAPSSAAARADAGSAAGVVGLAAKAANALVIDLDWSAVGAQ